MLSSNDLKRAVLYARVSTDEQARSVYSLAQQIEALSEHAAREGYEALEEVSDTGQSGASLERPGMDRVRDLVAAGGVSVVLAQDRDDFRLPSLSLPEKYTSASRRQEGRDRWCPYRATLAGSERYGRFVRARRERLELAWGGVTRRGQDDQRQHSVGT